MRALAILLLCTTACGRGRFDALAADAPPDESQPPADDAPKPPPVLACAAPRFSISASASTKHLSAAATQSGYDVFSVDDAGNVLGFAYNFAASDDALAAGPSAVPVASNANGPLASLAVGDDVLVAMPYGLPDPTGTALLALDPQLGTKSVAMHDGLLSDAGALTRNAAGAIALITQHLDDGHVDAALISSAGATVAGPYAVIQGQEAPYNQVILPARNGFLLSWANAGGANQVRAELLSQQLVVDSRGPITISPADVSPNAPRAAYLASADRYLFVWYQKAETVGDQVWASLRDGNLDEIHTGAILLSGDTQALYPSVIAGDDDFLVVWQSTTGSFVGAARVSKDGAVATQDVLNSSGWAINKDAKDLVVRYGQPALIWLETHASQLTSGAGIGSGSSEDPALTLWLDPVCSP